MSADETFQDVLRSRYKERIGDLDGILTEAMRRLYSVDSGKLSPMAASREIARVINILKELRGDK